MKKILFLSLTSLLILSSFSGCKKKDGVKVLKLSHCNDINHPIHKAMEFLAAKVKEKSGGKMRVDIYPSEQLGSEREAIERLQMGSLAMTKTSTAVLESFVPGAKVFGLPYLFRDSAHFWKVLQGPIGKDLLAQGEAKGLKGLCYYDAGARSFYTVNKPVNSPDDLTGMKIRVQKSKMSMKMVEAMGAAPTPIDFGELYTSLQQGVVDGAENNLPSFYSSLHYEICKTYSLDEHTAPPDVILISAQRWNKLTSQQQGILQAAIDESVEHQKKLWADFEQKSLDEVKKAGVTIIRPDKAPFREKVKELWAEFDGTEVGDLARKITEVE